MTTHTPPLPSADTDTGRPSHPLLSVVLPTALTLAAVLGIGVWLLHGSSPDPPVAVSAVKQRTAVASPAAAEGAPQPRQTEVVQTLYLVGSTEQADLLRQSIAEADAIRAAVGALPFSTAVLVIGAGEEEQILRALGDADATRDSLGLPGLVVVDLRTAA